MRNRLLCLLLVLGEMLGCGGAAEPERLADGALTQLVTYRSYEVHPPLDVFVVIATSAANGGDALRAVVARAIRERMHYLAEGELWRDDLWNPIDARAFVASAVDGSLGAPAAGVGPRSWREGDATTECASQFADEIEVAIAAAPDGEAAPGAIADALRRAAAAADSPDVAERLVVIVTTADDASVAADTDAVLRSKDSPVVVVPAARDCAPRSVPALSRWAYRSHGSVRAACSGLHLGTPSIHHGPACLPFDASACRVRALVARGTPCHRGRGWREPDRPELPLGPTAEGLDVCEITPLAGEEAVACSRELPYAGATGGWCVPVPTRRCAHPMPRLVGGAAPPSALIEIACERRTGGR